MLRSLNAAIKNLMTYMLTELYICLDNLSIAGKTGLIPKKSKLKLSFNKYVFTITERN